MPYSYPITNSLSVPNVNSGQTLSYMQYAQENSNLNERFKQGLIIVAGELSNVETIENDVLKPEIRKLVRESLTNESRLGILAKQCIQAGLARGYILANTDVDATLQSNVSDELILQIIVGVVNDEKLITQLFNTI